MANKIWQKAFLTQLAECGHVRKACEHAGVHFTTAYNTRRSDPEFAAQWNAALEEAGELLVQEAWRRASEGVDEPVFYKGQVCGTVRKYSDVLLIFLCKSIFPERFREKVYLSNEEMQRMYDEQMAKLGGDTAAGGLDDAEESAPVN